MLNCEKMSAQDRIKWRQEQSVCLEKEEKCVPPWFAVVGRQLSGRGVRAEGRGGWRRLQRKGVGPEHGDELLRPPIQLLLLEQIDGRCIFVRRRRSPPAP